ncbi:MAG: Smr/MutS family protein [Brevundimonas sp.]|jgi:DNA-nicking Smr family endonuclease|uniref:Smr/MutS family protein n=1 Tax=Brevundimonas sp. TaxID=1871086 RepID=UPI0039187147
MRRLSPEDRRLWQKIARSVTPLEARRLKQALLSSSESEPAPEPPAERAPSKARAGSAPPAPGMGLSGTPARTSAKTTAKTLANSAPAREPPSQVIEPNRARRVQRERDPIEARIDLHGYGRFQAEDAVVAFLSSSYARGHRTVLIITGHGRAGGGIIRASLPEWLSSERLRPIVAGHGPAHRRHGGEGATYVTLKRKK